MYGSHLFWTDYRYLPNYFANLFCATSLLELNFVATTYPFCHFHFGYWAVNIVAFVHVGDGHIAAGLQ